MSVGSSEFRVKKLKQGDKVIVVLVSRLPTLNSKLKLEGILIHALIAAVCGAGGDTTNKYLLGKLKLPIKYYLPYVFLSLSVISAFVLPLDHTIKAGAFSVSNILILVLMLISSMTWNILVAESLQTEPLHEYELIILLTPLVTIVLATIFLPVERNLHIFMAGIISSIALVAARLRRHHLELSKSAHRTMLAVLFIAIESVLLRQLLVFFSPPILYFIRVVIVTIVFFLMYKPDANVLKHPEAVRGLIMVGCFGTGLMVLKYYAFVTIGVSLSTIILLLGPVLTYLASYFYFHERRYFRRDLTAALVIVACIVYSVLAK